MVRLEDGIDAFAEAVRRHGLGSFRAAEANEIAAVEQRVVTLPDALRAWYASASPVGVSIPWAVEELTFFDVRELRDGQTGYRWSADREDVLSTGWDSSWLVIATAGGDPVIASTASSSAPVSLAMHGTGSWRPLEIAPDLCSFLVVMSAWIKVCVDVFDGEIRGKDFELREDFKERLDDELARLVGPEHRNALISFLE
jgi:hypothetical protein